MSSEEIYNYLKVNDRLITGGQPTEDQLRETAAEGFTAIINLAPVNPPYTPEDEAGLVQSLGLTYIHIPVDWRNPTDDDFAAFEAAMIRLPAEKVLIHCAANFRVTAFYSLYARRHLGWTEEQAQALRQIIWANDRYPVWEAFIGRKTAEIET
ncbi:MAG: protein tyrosine phosphatase family protein [Candidatus Promineofilum sp.]|nr:protein tyrosine phosphatase family protein [Promineifilum sp.]